MAHMSPSPLITLYPLFQTMKVLLNIVVIAAISFGTISALHADKPILEVDFSEGDTPPAMKQYKNSAGGGIRILAPEYTTPGYLSLIGAPGSGWRPGVSIPISLVGIEGWIKIVIVFRQVSPEHGAVLRLRNSVGNVDWFHLKINSSHLECWAIKGTKFFQNSFESGLDSPWTTLTVFIPLKEGVTNGLIQVADKSQPVVFKLPEDAHSVDSLIISAPGNASDFQVQSIKIEARDAPLE